MIFLEKALSRLTKKYLMIETQANLFLILVSLRLRLCIKVGGVP